MDRGCEAPTYFSPDDIAHTRFLQHILHSVQKPSMAQFHSTCCSWHLKPQIVKPSLAYRLIELTVECEYSVECIYTYWQLNSTCWISAYALNSIQMSCKTHLSTHFTSRRERFRKDSVLHAHLVLVLFAVSFIIKRLGMCETCVVDNTILILF
jgi:hypothetical protein